MSNHRNADFNRAPLSGVEPPGRRNDRGDDRQVWSRRRWFGVSVAAAAALLGLLLGGVSPRTALMLGGTLLAFASAAERLDHDQA